MADAPSRSGECADDPFEGRFVAFVDILGFCDLVNRAKTDRRTFEWLRGALARIDAQAQRLEGHRQLSSSPLPGRVVSSLPRTDVTMTAFSDCYLLSERASDNEGERSPWNLMAAVQALGSDLLARGILTRGAVVHGKAFHQDRIAFGPAIIDAYKLEKDVAKYPRILVTDRVREAIRWDNRIYWDDQLLLRDIDGSWFINVLTPPLSKWTTVSNDTSVMETSEFLGSIRSVLEDRLREARLNLRHLSKVKWLVHHFNLVAREHGLAINEDIESTTGTQPEQ